MEIAYVGRVAVVGDRYSASFSDLPDCFPEASSFVELESVAARVVEDHVRDHFREFQRLPGRYFWPSGREDLKEYLYVLVNLDYLLG